MYVWTLKAEKRAKRLGLEPRKAGTEALCGYKPVSGLIALSWLAKGYIKHAFGTSWWDNKDDCDSCVYHDYMPDAPPCDTCIAMHEEMYVYPAYRKEK